MDDELMFKIVFIATYAVFAGVRVYYRSQTLGRTSEKEYSQRTKAVVALSFAILGYFASIGLYIVVPQWIQVFHLPLPSFVRWFGVGLAVVGIALLVWIHHTLGRQYSAKWEIQEQHELITVGPYSRVRHPMYTTFNLFSLSVSLITANLLLVLFAIFVAIPFYWIARREEGILIDQFESEYLDYMDYTGRFLPSLSKFGDNSPEKEMV
ncbi:MAG: methyltransferase [Candidatus Thorarchaeota archaeon]